MASAKLIDRIRLENGAEVLADQLGTFLEIESGFIIVDADEEKGYYAQFAITDEETLHAEIVSNEYLEPKHRLSRSDIEEVQNRGWQTESDFNNYIRSWSRPLTREERMDIALTTLETLTDVYGVSGAQVAQVRTVLENLDQQEAKEIKAKHVTHQPGSGSSSMQK